MVTFAEAREIVRRQLVPAHWPDGLGEPVVRTTGEQSATHYRVHVDLADGDDLIDPPVILVDRRTGHVLTLPWTAALDPETPTEPVSA
jgi:hypothetical protein